MIPKTKHFDWIEDYCLGQLTKSQNLEFEAELGRNSELQEEVEFEMDLQSAVTETDVLNLRESLDAIANQEVKNEANNPFNLLEGLANIEELTDTVAPEDLLDFYDSLPKAHIYQHKLTSNENIHQFYKEQEHYLSEMESAEGSLEDMDFENLEGLDEAILEKDILNLRDTLTQVAKSIQPQFSVEDIDNYVSGNLEGKELELFEEEMSKNRALKQEVEMHLEMEAAVSELDVRSLRDEMSHIMETETSWNVSEESIEQFIDGELEEELLAEFNAELAENTDLKAELALRTNVNNSIAEKDIFALRDRLKQVQKENDSKEIKSLIPETSFEIGKWWRAGVAVAVILLAMAGVLNQHMGMVNNNLDNYYTSAEWSPERAVLESNDVNYLQMAEVYNAEGEHEKALTTYNKAIESSKEKFPYQFWKAALLQDLNNYQEAITEYTNVIEHGDNQFIEEAEWYRSYCYLKLEEWDAAKEQLLAIIEKKGFYENDARGILRRLNFTFK